MNHTGALSPSAVPPGPMLVSPSDPYPNPTLIVSRGPQILAFFVCVFLRAPLRHALFTSVNVIPPITPSIDTVDADVAPTNSSQPVRSILPLYYPRASGTHGSLSPPKKSAKNRLGEWKVVALLLLSQSPSPSSFSYPSSCSTSTMPSQRSTSFCSPLLVWFLSPCSSVGPASSSLGRPERTYRFVGSSAKTSSEELPTEDA